MYMICGDAMMLGFVFKLVANAVSHGAIPPQLFTTQTLISAQATAGHVAAILRI